MTFMDSAICVDNHEAIQLPLSLTLSGEQSCGSG